MSINGRESDPPKETKRRSPNVLACERAHLGVKRARSEEQSDPVGRSLVKRCQESEPALISVIRALGYAAHLYSNMSLLVGYERSSLMNPRKVTAVTNFTKKF